MRVLALLLLTLPLSAGCEGASANEAAPASGGGTAVGGEPSAEDLPSSLTFEAVEDLAPRQEVTLNVRALPAKVYHVRFALPTSNGEPLDAVLDRAEADTADDGVASVTLIAPSKTTSFGVRASVDNSVFESLTINVKDTGFAALRVSAAKVVGFRSITTWVASAWPGKTCADLAGIPPPDGPLVSLPVSNMEAPLLTQVPANTPLAVTLRSGHFVGGCASVEKVPPGPDSEPQPVHVTVLDRPIELGASTLAVSFNLAASDTAWSGLTASAGDAALAALDGTSTDDVDALLDAMRESNAVTVQAFENARKAENWDDLLRAHWGAAAATTLHATLSGWLTAGRQKLGAVPHLLEAALDPIAQPLDPLDQSAASLTVSAMAGLDPKRAGLVGQAHVSWSASADDTVVLDTNLYLVESRLATALAESAALSKSPDQTSAAGLWATTLGCAGIGNLLAGAGADAQLAYGTCDASCLQGSCENALSALWIRARDATALSPSRLSVTAAGSAYVGDEAEVIGLKATWIGQLQSSSGNQTTGGDLNAVEPTAP